MQHLHPAVGKPIDPPHTLVPEDFRAFRYHRSLLTVAFNADRMWNRARIVTGDSQNGTPEHRYFLMAHAATRSRIIIGSLQKTLPVTMKTFESCVLLPIQ